MLRQIPNRLRLAMPTHCVFPQVNSPFRRACCAMVGGAAVAGTTAMIVYGAYNAPPYDNFNNWLLKKSDNLSEWKKKQSKKEDAMIRWDKVVDGAFTVLTLPVQIIAYPIYWTATYVVEPFIDYFNVNLALIGFPITTVMSATGTVVFTKVAYDNVLVWLNAIPGHCHMQPW